MTDYSTDRTATIANGASLSGAVEIGDATVVALVMPAAWTAASITLQASVDGSTFVDVYKNNGASELEITVSTSRWVLLNLPDIAGLRGAHSIKVRSGTTGSPVAQGGARSIGVVLLPVG
jgi:hypothetical protein